MKIHNIISLLILFCSCNKTPDELVLLRKENSKLLATIDSLTKLQSTYSFRPVVVQSNSELKLGEEYIADIRLAIINKNYPALVIIDSVSYNSLPYILKNDTLKYDSYNEASTYKCIPESLGTYTVNGEIISHMPNQKYPYGFSITYKVIR